MRQQIPTTKGRAMWERYATIAMPAPRIVFHVAIHFAGMTFERDFWSRERAERFAAREGSRLDASGLGE